MRALYRSRSLAAGGLLALALAALVPAVASAKPQPGARPRGFRLFARSLGAMTVNRVYLGLNSSLGNIGGDSTGSSTIGGGFWPKGTGNQFVFNTGPQIAGKISNPGGAWDGDQTGSFFFDPKGTTQNGDGVQPIYNIQDPNDAAAWPDAARVPAELNEADNFYNPVLRGAKSASQGDVWFMSWDGNPTLISGRPHPLGVAVEFRGLGWNFPTGNEDIVYFTLTFYNVTSATDEAYVNVRPAIRPIVAQLGKDFVASNNRAFRITLPPGGYTIDSLFSAFGADMDVSTAGVNYCSVNLPFAMGFCYENNFTPSGGEDYSNTTIFGPPFLAGPGFVGVKYLRSPTGVGKIQLFSNTINSATGFKDPAEVFQLFRYLSGNLDPSKGDQACNVAGGQAVGVCFINPSAADSRFYESSTALTLPPGGFGSIVVAFLFAPPVAIPGFAPTASTDVKPGNPVRLTQAGLLQSGGANTIDSLTGFSGYQDANNDGIVTQNEFKTVPASLLNKALTAQTIFDNGFLLPFAPSTPNFYLVPGDNSVTIAWQPSISEATGDPYFDVASRPGTPAQPNPLYDPNYRQFDVEGYRIYRGRVDNSGSLTLIAQFDYAGTTFPDFTGQVQPSSTCGPGEPFNITAGCPVPFNYVPGSGVPASVSIAYPLVGQVVQIKLGSASRVELANGELLIIANSDTLLTGKADGGFPPLADTGVPFSFEDKDAKNNFRYFYSVTAFDVNSFQSGPASLESPRVSKAVTPVTTATNVADLPDLSFTVTDPNGTPYVQSSFSIDGTTGTFNAAPPPVAAVAVTGVSFQGARTLWPKLAIGDLAAVVDSVKMRGDGMPYPEDNIGAFDCRGRSNGQGLCAEYYFTYNQPGKPPVHVAIPVYQPILTTVFGDPPSVSTTTDGAAVPFSDTQLALYGVPPGVGSLQAQLTIAVGQLGNWSGGENFNGRRDFGSFSVGGSRWYTGANETLANPTYSIRVGHLPGVDSIYAPLSHIDQQPLVAGVQGPGNSVCEQVYLYTVAPFTRSADIELVWGAGGTVTVTDLTDRVPVPFDATPQAGYGFMPDGNGNGVIDWEDIAWQEDMLQAFNELGFCGELFSTEFGGRLPDPGNGAKLSQTATVSPVSFAAPGSEDPADFLPAVGSGFGLYIAGHYHIFQLTGGVLPAAGTRWVLRSYNGIIKADNNQGVSPSNYTYTPVPGNPAVPNMKINYVTSGQAGTQASTNLDLTKVHTVPDPYYVTNGFEATTENKVLEFVNLPSQAIIRIYTSSGILVNLLEHNSSSFGGNENWNLRNRNNQVVASGVYFYMIEAGSARKVGRFTVVNFAQ